MCHGIQLMHDSTIIPAHACAAIMNVWTLTRIQIQLFEWRYWTMVQNSDRIVMDQLIITQPKYFRPPAHKTATASMQTLCL